MDGKNVLIVGGSGTLGVELILSVLQTKVRRLRVFARNEHNIFLLGRLFEDERVEFFVGDIRDKDRLLKACEGMDIVFHLAALKHVPICEKTPTEAILTNVVGTENVIECSIAQRVELVVFSSTDKVVEPSCTYGCSKLLGEKLILWANEQSDFTRFVVFRSGNLFGSSGSVVPVFERQIEQNGVVKLTARGMSRFFISISRAARLLIECVRFAKGGEVFLPLMESVDIEGLARFMLAKKGLDKDRIEIVGIRSGEKLSECMITKEEGKFLFRVCEDLLMISREDSSFELYPRVYDFGFDSKDCVLPYGEMVKFLEDLAI